MYLRHILPLICSFVLQTGAAAAPQVVRQPSSTPNSKVSGWVQEKYTTLMGKTTSIATNQGYLLSNPQGGFDVICAPPSWSVIAVSEKKKMFFVYSDGHTVKPEVCLGLMKASFDFDPSAAKWERVGAATCCGHAAEIWRARKRANSSNTPKDSFDGFEFWVAKDIPIPPSLAAVQTKTNGYPAINYLALRFLRLHPRRKPQVFLDTLSLKPINVSTSIFRAPVVCKQTANERDISIHTGDLQTMLEGLGLGDEKK